MSVQQQTPVLTSSGDVGRTELIDELLGEIREIGDLAVYPAEMDLVNDIEMFIAWMYDHSLGILEGTETHHAPHEMVTIGARLVDEIGTGAVSAIANACAKEAKVKFDTFSKRGERFNERHNVGDADRCDSGIFDA